MEVDPSGRTMEEEYNGGERGQRRTGRTNSFNGSDSVDQEFIVQNLLFSSWSHFYQTWLCFSG